MRPTFNPRVTAAASQDPWYIGACDGVNGHSRSTRSARGTHIPSVLYNAVPHEGEVTFYSQQNSGDFSCTNLRINATSNTRPASSSTHLMTLENDAHTAESEGNQRESNLLSSSPNFVQPQSSAHPHTSGGYSYHSVNHRDDGEYTLARPDLHSNSYNPNSIGTTEQFTQVLSATSGPRPSTGSPRARRSAEFLDFLVCHLPLLAGNNTEQITQHVQDAFRQYLAENDSDISEYSEIIQDFKPRVGSEASRNERNKRQTHATTDRCPVRGCSSTFTRRNGLKNHIAAHFSLLPRTCEFCQTDLTIPSLRRHEKTCRARPPTS